jgi:hypothetical protein
VCVYVCVRERGEGGACNISELVDVRASCSNTTALSLMDHPVAVMTPILQILQCTHLRTPGVSYKTTSLMELYC